MLFRPKALGPEVPHLIQRREDISLHFDMIGAFSGRAVWGLVMGSGSSVSALYQIVEGTVPSRTFTPPYESRRIIRMFIVTSVLMNENRIKS